jgi:hypothetical protein
MGEEVNWRLDCVVSQVVDENVHEPPGAIRNHDLTSRIRISASERAPYQWGGRHEWGFVTCIKVGEDLLTFVRIPVTVHVEVRIELLGVVAPELQRDPAFCTPPVDPRPMDSH